MKKKLLALFLALTMAVSLVTPAIATGDSEAKPQEGTVTEQPAEGVVPEEVSLADTTQELFTTLLGLYEEKSFEDAGLILAALSLNEDGQLPENPELPEGYTLPALTQEDRDAVLEDILTEDQLDALQALLDEEAEQAKEEPPVEEPPAEEPPAEEPPAEEPPAEEPSTEEPTEEEPAEEPPVEEEPVQEEVALLSLVKKTEKLVAAELTLQETFDLLADRHAAAVEQDYAPVVGVLTALTVQEEPPAVEPPVVEPPVVEPPVEEPPAEEPEIEEEPSAECDVCGEPLNDGVCALCDAENMVGYTGVLKAGVTVYASANENALFKWTLVKDHNVTIVDQFVENGALWYEYEVEIAGFFDPALYGFPYVKAEDVTFDVEVTEDEVSASLELGAGECEITVSGDLPEGAALELNDITADDYERLGLGVNLPIVLLQDIKILDADGEEWQPAEGESLTISMDAYALGLEDGDEVEIFHEHNGEVSSLGTYTIEDGLLTFETNGFSIYAVIGTYYNDWNYNNYAIYMSVGDNLQVKATSNNASYWDSSDTSVLTVTETRGNTATIYAVDEGTVTLSKGNQKIAVTVVEAQGSISNDIIFKRITANHQSNDATSITEYGNTYGPYVMKIRFEDTEGNLLNMGEDYYVFDSETIIDINTFAADAPNGYTYAGAFFYWAGHYSGDKAYVTSIERVDSNTASGSHLYFNGTLQSSGAGRWTYQASGVLHIVYAPIEEVHTVIFKDHCGYELANYALTHNDRGVKFPSGYVDNIENMASSLIPNHHASHDSGYVFTGNWVVTGGRNGINGTYTTEQLRSNITKWNITSNITITAQCAESNVTIYYAPVGGGIVDRSFETLKAASGTAQGSTATANSGYSFEGWYSNSSCTGTPISTEATFTPTKTQGTAWVDGTTYYAKFVENEVTINYEAVGPVGATEFGSVDRTAENNLKVLTGTAYGSTPTAADGYRFVGWFTDEDCTVSVDTTWVSSDNKIVPQKSKDYDSTAEEVLGYEGATYYAKFVENTATITYIALPLDGQEVGTVDLNDSTVNKVAQTSESFGVVTGDPVGATAEPNSTVYKFVGWYTNENCTGDPISTDATYVPTKGADAIWPETTTFYAKFEYNLTSLTITKTARDASDNERFIFNVSGPGIEGGMQIVLKAGESKTISGLKVDGVYTVTEDTNWSWRYTPTGGATKTTAPLSATATNNTVTFENTKYNNKWLSAVASAINTWTSTTITQQINPSKVTTN